MKILEGQELYHCWKKRQENAVKPRKYFNDLFLES